MTRAFRLVRASWPAQQEALYVVRRTVFVVEQGVPEEIEIDEWDTQSIHMLACDESGQAIGCGRLLPDGQIGRMAVLSSWRGRGVGSALLTALIEEARQRSMDTVVLSAQTQALPFYEGAGFVAYGPVYDEAGIPHRKMKMTL